MLGLEIEAFADISAEAFAARKDFETREDFERETFGSDQWLGERTAGSREWPTA